MILVAATAAGLAYLRQTAEGYDNFRRNICINAPVAGWIAGGCWVATTLLTAWTVAFLVLHARPPRPGRRRLARQPGLIACGAAGLSVMVALTRSGMADVLQYHYMDRAPVLMNFGRIWNLLDTVTYLAGPAVIVAWAVLIYGRNWRPEAGWIDRLGTALGALWVAEYLASHTGIMLRSINW
jgi:hypothetical protein